MLSYNTEAVIWGAYIDKHMDELSAGDGKVAVAGFVANSEFGATYDSAFKTVIAQSPNKDKIEYFTEKVEITAPTVTDPMTTLASKNPDVFITMTGATHCPQIINEAANNGMKEKTKVPCSCRRSARPRATSARTRSAATGRSRTAGYIVGGGFKDFNAEA